MSLNRFDLKDTVFPEVSIDEFQPKSGTPEEIIVVGLYCADKGPATDLNTFIQRGNYANIDAEVSPNPDEDGKFIVFVEFERNKEFLNILPLFLKDIENLTDKMDWQIKPYLSDKPLPMDTKKIKKFIIVDPSKVITKEAFQAEQANVLTVEDKTETLLKDSYLNRLTFEDGYVIFNERVAAKLVDLDHEDAILESHDLSDKAMALDVPPAEVGSLWAMLGEQYEVTTIGKQTIVYKRGSQEILILEDLMFVHKL